MASGRIAVTQGTFVPSTSLLACSRFHFALARHCDALPGSCFEKNDKTLVQPRRSWLSPFRFQDLHSFRALPSRNHLVSDLFRSHTCGFFSAFTRATCSLSVSNQYLGLGFNSPSSFDISKPNYSHLQRLTLLSLRGCHSLWLLFPEHSAGIMSSSVAHTSFISQ